MYTTSIEIARTPEEVFDYVAQLDRHKEWQHRIVDSHLETEGPTRVGTRHVEKRKVPGGPREFTTEITECERPRRLAFKGLNGPVRPEGAVTIEPAGDGSRSKLTFEFDLVGHGFGKLIRPLALRDARKEIPIDQQALKNILESRAS